MIEAALTAARCVIVVWSASSVASTWVRAEAEDARTRGILVPILVDNVKIPFPFGQIQAADLTGWAGTATTVGSMICARPSALSSPRPARLPKKPSRPQRADRQIRPPHPRKNSEGRGVFQIGLQRRDRRTHRSLF